MAGSAFPLGGSANVPMLSGVPTGRIVGRVTAGTGQSENLTPAEVGSLFAGTAFPGAPVDRQTFFRTDRDLGYFYDLANTRWLTVHEYAQMMSGINIAVDTTVSGLVAAANAGRMVVPYRGLHSVLITRFDVWTLVGASGNGNTPTHFWTAKLNAATAADADTQIGNTISTAADTAAQNFDHSVSPNVVLNANARVLKLRVDKNNAPADLHVAGSVYYRLVG